MSKRSNTMKHVLPPPLIRNERLLNRELSWLAFNMRVLQEANNPNNPLLERIKFLAISASNLDEFIMVRIAGLKSQIRHEMEETSVDGFTPKEQLHTIQDSITTLFKYQNTTQRTLQDECAKQGITFLERETLTAQDRAWLKEYFDKQIFPLLTPIAINEGHPFPFLPNLSLAYVVSLKPQTQITPIRPTTQPQYADKEEMIRSVIPLPSKLKRFIQMPSDGTNLRYIALEEIIGLFNADIFPGFKVVRGGGLLRITRDSELVVSDEAEDLIRTFESAVRRRHRGDIVQVLTSSAMSQTTRDFVAEHLGIDSEDVEDSEGLIDLAALSELYDIDRPDLKFPVMRIRFPERVNDYGGDCFAAIRAKDIVVHHPYESFDVVVRLLKQAAEDPDVISIKQTMYRTSNDSPIVHALIDAAEAGKSVTAVVELQARFDEAANLRWGRDLERAGAQVVYSISGLKTHAKMSLIMRQEGGSLQPYVHIGTGNYHHVTAKIYTDLSFFTCDPLICQDAAMVFNFLTGHVKPDHFNKLFVSPLNMRSKMLEMIQGEIDNAKAGKPAHIWAKMNSLVDSEMIESLYTASNAGVKVRLFVRGICCLRPGVKGMSENIVVKSMVGRFLEHARIYCFGNGHDMPSPEAKVFIGSADWMPRNLDRRVEVVVPVENSTVHAQVLDQIMMANDRDERQSWAMQSDGSYKRNSLNVEDFSAHDYFLNNPSLSGRGSALHGHKLKPVITPDD